MAKTLNTPDSLNVVGKDRHYNQLAKVYKAFFEQPKTMKEVDLEVGVMRENICWYCRTLRKQERLFAIRKRICAITKHKAIEWTTNPELVPPPIQLNLF